MVTPKLTETTMDKMANGGLAPPHDLPPLKLITPIQPADGSEVGQTDLPLYGNGKSGGASYAWTVVPENVKIERTPDAEKKPELKIAIVGTAPSSNQLAPYDDPSWKIWVCSPGNMQAAKRVDAWFEIHGNLHWQEHAHYGLPYLEWLKKQGGFPIYMQDQSYVPNALTFPREDLVKEFGRYFFTSSFAWMIAFAIKQGATEIALFGVDMASQGEYITQRAGAYYFFQECARRGVKISAPYESDLMQPPGQYGYSDVTPFGRKLYARKQEVVQRISGLEQQVQQLQNNLFYMKGALEDVDYMINIWIGAQER